MAAISGFFNRLKIGGRKEKECSFDDFDGTELVCNDVLCANDEDRISHIYEEIPGSFVDDEGILPIEYRASNLDFKNARDIGPYLVVPILGCYGNQVFRKDDVPPGADELLPAEVLSKRNCPRNRQFNVLDNAQLCENLDKNSTYCTIPSEDKRLSSCSSKSGYLRANTRGNNDNANTQKVDSDDSCGEYDVHGTWHDVGQEEYQFYLARAAKTHGHKQGIIKLVRQPNTKGEHSELSGATSRKDDSHDAVQEDAVSVTTNASDCTSNSSDSGNASLYTCSDMSSCSEGAGWYDTTEALSIDTISGEDFNCAGKTGSSSEQTTANTSQTKDNDSSKIETSSEKTKSKRDHGRRKKKRDNAGDKADEQKPAYKIVTFVRNETDRMSCRAIDCTIIKRKQTKTARATTNNVGLYGSNNRALNDLMKMNHDRQLFMM